MELNREQIIKALEYCANHDECVGVMCPYYATGCEKLMPKDALSLINELTEEVNDLKEDKELYSVFCEDYKKQIKKLTEENERLRAEKKRGYWFTDYARQPLVICSNCNLSNNYSRSKYCPHCGARMDGK